MRNLVLKTLVIIMLIFVLFPSGHANAVDGNKLVEHMREYEKFARGESPEEYHSVGYYMGYVIGVLDASLSKWYSYASNNITKGQLFAIVANYLNEHPERWNQPASELVIEALKQAFPRRR